MLASSVTRAANTPLLRLSTPEVFVVMSMRLWFSSQLNPDVGVADWREGFDRAQLPLSAAPTQKPLRAQPAPLSGT